MNNIELNKEERTALRAIYTGHDTLCDLVDFLGKPTKDIILLTDKLEILGYIERCSNTYNDYLRFKLTKLGERSLPEMDEKEKKLAEEYGISIEDYITLKEADKLGVKRNHAFNISDNANLPTMLLVSCANNLEEKGYVKMVGIFRRYLKITEKGKQILHKIG